MNIHTQALQPSPNKLQFSGYKPIRSLILSIPLLGFLTSCDVTDTFQKTVCEPAGLSTSDCINNAEAAVNDPEQKSLAMEYLLSSQDYPPEAKVKLIKKELSQNPNNPKILSWINLVLKDTRILAEDKKHLQKINELYISIKDCTKRTPIMSIKSANPNQPGSITTLQPSGGSLSDTKIYGKKCSRDNTDELRNAIDDAIAKFLQGFSR